MRYLTAVLALCVGLMVGWLLGSRNATSLTSRLTDQPRVTYRVAEPAAGPLRLDSLVLQRNHGFTPNPQYRISIAKNGRVAYRGYPGVSVPESSVLGRAGDYVTQIDPREFGELSSLAVWPETRSNVTPLAGPDTRHAQLTLFFSKTLVGEGDPDFASLVEDVLKGSPWDAAGAGKTP